MAVVVETRPRRVRNFLEEDGVTAVWTEEGWKVDLKTYGWKNTMDDALYLKSLFDQAEKEGVSHESTEPGYKG